MIILCSEKSNPAELLCNFLTPVFCLFVCLFVYRSLLPGQHLVHPGRQAEQGPQMWLVSHPWLRWRNQTPTWKVRYLTSQDYMHHLMQNLNEALWSHGSLFIRTAQITHDCAVKQKQCFCESLNMSTLVSLSFSSTLILFCWIIPLPLSCSVLLFKTLPPWGDHWNNSLNTIFLLVPVGVGKMKFSHH